MLPFLHAAVGLFQALVIGSSGRRRSESRMILTEFELVSKAAAAFLMKVSLDATATSLKPL
jgi:hypothetical protein